MSEESKFRAPNWLKYAQSPEDIAREGGRRAPMLRHERDLVAGVLRPPHLSKRHRLVLAALRKIEDESDYSTPKSGTCSVADLARLTGLSPTAAAFARSDLARWGLVEVAWPGAGRIAPRWRVLVAETDEEFLRRAGLSAGG